jgi:hypothetical protein
MARPHPIEIWFALYHQTLYLLSEGRERADWVKKAKVQPNVTVQIQEVVLVGQARPVSDPAEDALARQLIGKNYPEEADGDSWLINALPVAVDRVR